MTNIRYQNKFKKKSYKINTEHYESNIVKLQTTNGSI